MVWLFGRSDKARAVPPLAEWSTMSAQERLLLELAPHNPINQVVGEGSISTVRIHQVKDGFYSDQKAILVWLDVQLANTKIASFTFDVFYTVAASDSCKSVMDGRPKSPPPRDHTQPNKSSRTQGKVEPSRTMDKTTLERRSLWGSVGRKASDFMEDMSRKRSAVCRTLNTRQRAPPSPTAPKLVAYGPAIVYGPPTKVTLNDMVHRIFSPKVKAEAVEVEVGSLGHDINKKYDTKTSARIDITVINQGLKVHCQRAAVGDNGCPLRFRVGFVVLSPSPIDLEARHDTSSWSEWFHWSSPPVKRTLVDTTRGGTAATAGTCACCPAQDNCKQFHQFHMAPSKWKEKLLHPLDGWDLDVNENHWVLAPEE